MTGDKFGNSSGGRIFAMSENTSFGWVDKFPKTTMEAIQEDACWTGFIVVHPITKMY